MSIEPGQYQTFGFFYFMQVHELQVLKSEAREIARIFVIGEVEAIKIAIELRKLESIQEISYFLRKDG